VTVYFVIIYIQVKLQTEKVITPEAIPGSLYVSIIGHERVEYIYISTLLRY
jgi:hypothetical protein